MLELAVGSAWGEQLQRGGCQPSSAPGPLADFAASCREVGNWTRSSLRATGPIDGNKTVCLCDTSSDLFRHGGHARDDLG